MLRALAPGDENELWRIHSTPQVARWWDSPPPDFPWDEPESTRLTIEVAGAIGGLIQFWEESEPKYRHGALDIFLDPALHGRGLGSAALRTLARSLIEERGHHRMTVDPAAANVTAIRAMRRSASCPSESCAHMSATATGPAGTTPC